MTYCNHISRVKSWGFDKNHNFKATEYDCVLCGLVSLIPFTDEDNIDIDHTGCDEDCFGCKVKTLELSTGDANSQKSMSNKKWNNELDAYRSARAQGIQPAGTSMAHIKAAVEASDTMGQAYDAGTAITPAETVTKKSVASLKEVGAI
jgi:hypothetical protein